MGDRTNRKKSTYLKSLIKALPLSNFMSDESPTYSPVSSTDPDYKDGGRMDVIGGCRYMNSPPEPNLIEQYKRENKRVTLNVGGERHEVMWKTLGRVPYSRLGRLRKAYSHEEILDLVDDYSLVENEFYFDRQPESFSAVVNLYRTGKLHLCEDVCVTDFAAELEYWGIDYIFMEECCVAKFCQRREDIFKEIQKNIDAMKEEEEEDFGNGPFAKIQKYGFDVLEKPTSCIPATIVATISISFIVISTTSMALNTMPSWQRWACRNESDAVCVANLEENKPQPGMPVPPEVKQVGNPYLDAIEGICILWFTMEYLLRFVFSPDKMAFMKDTLNFIDVLAILPYYLSTFVIDMDDDGGGGGEEDVSKKIFKKFMNIFRLMRILRVFKLGRHSVGLKSLGHTMTTSYNELGILLTFLGGGVLIFSCVEFFAEMEDNREMFESIPHTFWWALITMTTVGYGDMSPATGIGQLVGSLCAVVGVLVIALPIPIIGTNFVEYYQNENAKAGRRQRKEELEKAKRESARYQRDKNHPNGILDRSAESSRARLHVADFTPNREHDI